jgi:hypothetical protein
MFNRPFALESVSRRETAEQGQTTATHVRVCRESTPTAKPKELNTLLNFKKRHTHEKD